MRRQQVPPLVPQAIEQEGFGLERAIARPGPGRIREIIGIHGEGAIAHTGAVNEKPHHVRTRLQVSVDQLRIRLIPRDHRIEIGPGLGQRIPRACRHGVVVAGNPDTAPGPGARTAIARSPFYHQDVRCAELVTTKGGGESTVAGTGHEHVDLVVPVRRSRRARVLGVRAFQAGSPLAARFSAGIHNHDPPVQFNLGQLIVNRHDGRHPVGGS